MAKLKTVEMTFDHKTGQWVTPKDKEQSTFGGFFSKLNMQVDDAFKDCDNFW